MNSKKYNITMVDGGIALCILLSTAIFTFGFFSVITDALRYINLQPIDKELIFSGDSRLYFDVFYAGIGLLLGQSFALQFLQFRVNLKSFHEVRILHSSRWLIWCLVLLIGRGFITLISFREFFMVDSMEFIIPLVVVIMLSILGLWFTYSWNGLRQFVIGGQLKKLLGGLLIFYGLSFSIAQIQWIDRAKLDVLFLSQNVTYTHDIDYPKSVIEKEVARKSNVEEIIVGKNSTTKEVEVFINNNSVELHQASEVLIGRDRNFRHNFYRPSIGLIVDKDLTLEELMPVFYQLHLSKLNKILVYVDSDEDDIMFNYKFSPNLLYDYLKELEANNLNRVDTILYPLPFRIGYLTHKVPSLEVIVNQNTTLLEGQNFVDTIYQQQLEQLFKENNTTCYTSFLVDLKTTFGDYIHIKSQLFKAHYNLREEESLKTFGKSYSDLYWEEQKTLRKKYPTNILEFGLKQTDKAYIKSIYKEQHKLSYDRLEKESKLNN